MANRTLPLGLGRVFVGAGALLLLVSLFLDWFEPSLSGWTAFEVVDLILAALAIGAAMAVFDLLPVPELRAPRAFPREHGYEGRFAALALGLLALALVLLTIVNHPPQAADQSLDFGVWIALAGAALIVLGGMLGSLRVSIAIESTDAPLRAPAARDRRDEATTPLPRDSARR